MKKLKNKVFFIILFILSLSLISIIFLYNFQVYNSKLDTLNNYFDSKDKMNPPDKLGETIDENVKYVDQMVYTILLDKNNNIIDIINHTNEDIDTESITSIATDILNSKPTEEYIGNLYLTNYSYHYSSGNSLVLIDNSNIKTELLTSLKLSIIIFIFLELLIILISKLITYWIIKPVEESFNKQKEFIADASHELKTPLSVIMASSEALEDNPKELKWLKNIKSESERMNKLIIDLLELAKSERKELNVYSYGDLSKTVELAVLTFEGIAYEKKIKIDYNIEPNIKMNYAEDKIKELIEILLDNAIKHSSKKNTINVSLTTNGNNITLCVKNKGEEIPKGEEEKIFERFYRTDKSRNRNDNRYGLGLAIAKNIVENHNGKISAESSLGTTTFKIVFKKQ